VIFAAQEKLIKTPAHLRVPEDMLGDRAAVEQWLSDHAADFEALAEQRRIAADAYREEVIRRNMRELIDLLIADSDRLPCEAAERISVRRIAAKESGRTASDLMAPLPTIALDRSVRDAAAALVEAGSPIVAVVGPNGELAGVATEWDITRATAHGSPDDQPIAAIMTREVIVACPTDGILDLLRKLEYHGISAMPVVERGAVLGLISTDLLARRSLLRLLQSQID